jgi:hypothetical protein
MKRLLTFGLLAAALATSGCSHAMRITNLHEYQPAPTAPLHPPKVVGITSRNIADPATRGFVDAVAQSLRLDPSFDVVMYPYDARRDADLVLDISVSPRYSGRGSNFLVNWPGFLIFAPAIWGYGYEAVIETQVSIRDRDGSSQELTIPTQYRFRQAEIDRTWTELGWLEVGIIPLIGGLAFTRYDPDVTPEFVAKVAPNYGAYVARRIREILATAGDRDAAPSALPATPARPISAIPRS